MSGRAVTRIAEVKMNILYVRYTSLGIATPTTGFEHLRRNGLSSHGSEALTLTYRRSTEKVVRIGWTVVQPALSKEVANDSPPSLLTSSRSALARF